MKATTSSLTEELYMKKYRTVACVIIMAIAAIAGFFIGATLDEIMGGAILFSMIAGIACIVYSIENREE
jgi:inner membrane protein involved in colicin E2 resistance